MKLSRIKCSFMQAALRIFIGGIFIYVGYARLRNAPMVAEHIMALDILPWGLVNFFAMWMLCFELLLGIFVIAGLWLRATSLLLVGFCALCLGLISYALSNGLSLHCGCFVTSPTGLARTWGSLWQELAMLLGCAWLLAVSSKKA